MGVALKDAATDSVAAPSWTDLLLGDVRAASDQRDARIGADRANMLANSAIFLLLSHLICGATLLWAVASASQPVSLAAITVPLGCVLVLDGAFWLSTRLGLSHHVVVRLSIAYAVAAGSLWSLLVAPAIAAAGPETDAAIRAAISGGFVFLIPAFLSVPVIIVGNSILAISVVVMLKWNPLHVACLVASNAALAWFSLAGARTAIVAAQARVAAEDRANSLARHDALTGLPNRRLLVDELERLSKVTGQQESAIFLLDIDGFKWMNDIHGIAAGDEVLVEVAERMRSVAGNRGLVARLGGDEFACLMRSLDVGDDVAALAAQFCSVMDEPIKAGANLVEAVATVGIARYPADVANSTELLGAAHTALAQAKRECRSGFAFFDAKMNAPAAPDASGGSRTAADRGEVQPFVINDITETIFRESCRTAREWPTATAVRVSVSSVQLKDPWLAPRILAIVSSTGIATSRLVLEVSASALADASEAALEALESLQKAGMRLALHDLEGQPTPPRAGRLTFDEIKFDSSLASLLERPHEMEITIALAARRRLAR